MKKVIFALAILAFSTLSLVSCRETKEKTIVIEKEVKEEATEEKGILERAGEKADKEVNEEIDKKIEEIGDDN
ncbi:hypothetical protein SB49_11590 [Sediminicola sp. YIK13]|uniref:hypothetical protein n=1 Tax=Sediminicola sp. YIK13 TaxID=1453352 RepID=UPI000722F8FB|nr:hypothetical protein [Sediminicola sp. YIK13]ALM08380.1 hypothetical protein SB49_11590 [Sediminicola sp. YIK13]